MELFAPKRLEHRFRNSVDAALHTSEHDRPPYADHPHALRDVPILDPLIGMRRQSYNNASIDPMEG